MSAVVLTQLSSDMTEPFSCLTPDLSASCDVCTCKLKFEMQLRVLLHYKLKKDCKLLSMSSSNIDQFSTFFQSHTEQEICSEIIIKEPTTLCEI